MQSVKSEILKEYERLRDIAKADHQTRKDEIYSLLPQIREIDDDIARISMKSVRSLILKGESEQPAVLLRLEKDIEPLRMKKAMLLTENSIPLNYLDIHYSCDKCSDSGILKNGDMCSCFKQKLTTRLYEMSSIKMRLSEENFDNFNLKIFSDRKFDEMDYSPKRNMEKILAASRQFVDDFDHSDRNLLFYGATGLGKTFLCNCIAKSLMDSGFSVLYQTSFKILEILEKARFKKTSDSSTSNVQYDMLFECDLLIIDDLGTELVNSFTNAEIFNIINSRILSGKSMIISTNLTPSEIIDNYSTRISSRVFGKFDIHFFYGHDLRWESK